MTATPAFSREYPPCPILSVAAVIVHDDRVVLVRRRHEPLAGMWSLPGGRVEVGETLDEALRREVREETGREVDVGGLVALLDRIHRDAERRVRFHYVLADYVCYPIGGTLAAGSDASDVATVSEAELARFELPPVTRDVILRGLAMARERQ